MKKVINTIIGIVVIGFIIYFIQYYTNIYIPLDNKKVTTDFIVSDGNIYSSRHDKLKQITIKGVNLDNFIPGHIPSDYAITQDIWLRWFKLISKMGANTIKITNINNPTFYDALYKYNSASDTPLYLIQGISISDYVNNNANDAYASDFYSQLYEDCLCAVDVIHGKRNIASNEIHGSGIYRKDVSKWVIGYIVGNEWNSATIAYTNHKNEGGAFRGNYISTIENANAFEVLLCKIMDATVTYESDKYGKQRLISFANDPLYDPFIYNEGYDLLYNKYVDLDIEDLKQRHYKGLFAAYSIYELCDDYEKGLSERTKNKLHNIKEIGHKDGYLHGYVEILSKYHMYPVVVTSFECSTSRGVIKSDTPYNETDQGHMLVNAYNNIMDSGAKGAIIESWQDSWVKRSSNTSYGINPYNSENWHDVQTLSQNKGILAFEPVNKYHTVYLDGDFGDFDGTPQIGTFGNLTVNYSYDAQYIYFLVKGNQNFYKDVAYLTFDITPNSGSYQYYDDTNSLEFDRGIDFVLRIDGKNNTKLFVQDRYDGFKENYTDALYKKDVFANPPAKGSNDFAVVGMLQHTQGVDDATKSEMTVDEYLEVLKVCRYDTGNFRYGITNPASADFNSLADFCFGRNGVEIRIPWTLLNFSDPSQCLVHKDYYECFGREDMRISEIYVAACNNEYTNVILMPAKLHMWNSDIKIEERLKSSYEIIKEAWNGIE